MPEQQSGGQQRASESGDQSGDQSGDPSQGQGDEQSSPLSENPPGYIPPGQGIDDLAGADHAVRKTAQRMQEIEQRTQAVSGDSGGFKFDLETMRTLAPEWKEIAKELQEIFEEARTLGQAQPPAHETASLNQIESVYDHARICASIHEQMFQYADQYADDMETAINRIEAADQASADTMRDAGREL